MKNSLLWKIICLILVIVIIIIYIFCCNKKCPESTPTKPGDDTTKTSFAPPDCAPVKITELRKLELSYTDYTTLRANSIGGGNAGQLTFQFAYNHNATNRLTLAAYATKPGRNFLPPVLKYLTEVQGAPVFNLPASFSLGDQYVTFGTPQGLDQLIIGRPANTTILSLTFTPNIKTTLTPTAPPPSSVINVYYNICVKYRTNTGQVLEWCGAGPSETQPSPPAN